MKAAGVAEGKAEGIIIGQNNVIKGAVGGISQNGNLVTSYAIYNGSIFAEASMQVSGGSSDPGGDQPSSDWDYYYEMGWNAYQQGYPRNSADAYQDDRGVAWRAGWDDAWEKDNGF